MKNKNTNFAKTLFLFTQTLILTINYANFVHAGNSKNLNEIKAKILKGELNKQNLGNEPLIFSHPGKLSVENFQSKNLIQIFDLSLMKLERVDLKYKGTTKDDRNEDVLFHELQGNFESSEVNSPDKINSISFKLYHSVGKNRPLVILFSPIVGTTIMDDELAIRLAKNNMNVLIPNLPDAFDPKLSLDKSVEISKNNLISVRMILNYLLNKNFNSYDSQRIGALGVSLGGVYVASLLGIEPLVSRGFMVASGGGLASIFLNSTQERVILLRNNIFKNFPESQNPSFRDSHLNSLQWLQSHLITDPLFYASNAVGKKMYMVISTEDQMIPFENQLELWNALGRPEYEASDYSHIGTVLRWYVFFSNKILNFFEK